MMLIHTIITNQSTFLITTYLTTYRTWEFMISSNAVIKIYPVLISQICRSLGLVQMLADAGFCVAVNRTVESTSYP